MAPRPAPVYGDFNDLSPEEQKRALGYESENAFNTAFRRVMGMSPRRYAKAETASLALS